MGRGAWRVEAASQAHEVIFMADLIIVLNAGSSSLKFTNYALTAKSRKSVTMARSRASTRRPDSRQKTKPGRGWRIKSGPPGSSLDHEGAMDALFAWGRGVLSSSDPVVAVGHRVVHGRLKYTKPTIVNDHILDNLEGFRHPGAPSASATQPGPHLCH